MLQGGKLGAPTLGGGGSSSVRSLDQNPSPASSSANASRGRSASPARSAPLARSLDARAGVRASLLQDTQSSMQKRARRRAQSAGPRVLDRFNREVQSQLPQRPGGVSACASHSPPTRSSGSQGPARGAPLRGGGGGGLATAVAGSNGAGSTGALPPSGQPRERSGSVSAPKAARAMARSSTPLSERESRRGKAASPSSGSFAPPLGARRFQRQPHPSTAGNASPPASDGGGGTASQSGQQTPQSPCSPPQQAARRQHGAPPPSSAAEAAVDPWAEDQAAADVADRAYADGSRADGVRADGVRPLTIRPPGTVLAAPLPPGFSVLSELNSVDCMRPQGDVPNARSSCDEKSCVDAAMRRISEAANAAASAIAGRAAAAAAVPRRGGCGGGPGAPPHSALAPLGGILGGHWPERPGMLALDGVEGGPSLDPGGGGYVAAHAAPGGPLTEPPEHCDPAILSPEARFGDVGIEERAGCGLRLHAAALGTAVAAAHDLSNGGTCGGLLLPVEGAVAVPGHWHGGGGPPPSPSQPGPLGGSGGVGGTVGTGAVGQPLSEAAEAEAGGAGSGGPGGMDEESEERGGRTISGGGLSEPFLSCLSPLSPIREVAEGGSTPHATGTRETHDAQESPVLPVDIYRGRPDPDSMDLHEEVADEDELLGLGGTDVAQPPSSKERYLLIRDRYLSQ